MSKNKKTADFESQMDRLQRVVAELEQSDLPLEKSVSLYQEGQTLVKACREQLENARLAVSLRTEEGVQPFAAEKDGEDER